MYARRPDHLRRFEIPAVTMTAISTPCDDLVTRRKESMDADVIIPTVVPSSPSCLQYSARVFSGVCITCFVPSKFSATFIINMFEAAHAPPLYTAELRIGCSALNPTQICAGVCFSSNRLSWIIMKMKSALKTFLPAYKCGYDGLRYEAERSCSRRLFPFWGRILRKEGLYLFW